MDANRELLADLCRMADTGEHSFTGEPLGTALASRLPRIIAGVRRLVEAGATARSAPDGRRHETRGAAHG